MSVVYFTSEITPEGLLAIYEALDWNPTGKVAVKLSTGEPPASNYLRPELIKDLVQSVDGTIVECNTAYGGSRAQTAMHYQVAEDHGFTAIADFQILDENGSISLPVTGGSRLTENFVGAAFGMAEEKGNHYLGKSCRLDEKEIPQIERKSMRILFQQLICCSFSTLTSASLYVITSKKMWDTTYHKRFQFQWSKKSKLFRLDSGVPPSHALQRPPSSRGALH